MLALERVQEYVLRLVVLYLFIMVLGRGGNMREVKSGEQSCRAYIRGCLAIVFVVQFAQNVAPYQFIGVGKQRMTITGRDDNSRRCRLRKERKQEQNE